MISEITKIMIHNAEIILSQINAYTVTLAAIACLLLLSLISIKIKQNFKIPLRIICFIWVIFFGYHIYTGNNLYYAITSPSQNQIEAAKYKRVMIDGREVIYNKDTGEIVK